MVRVTTSHSPSSQAFLSRTSAGHRTVGQAEQYAIEPAVMAAEIEQLPDRAGFLKFASLPAWIRVSFPVY